MVQLADNYAAWELSTFQDAFEKSARATGDKLHQQDIADVLIPYGIIPLRRVIVQALAQIDTQELNFLDFSQFINIMAIYRIQEGFTYNHISAIHRVFHDLA